MKSAILAALLACSFSSAYAGMAFFKYEQTSGMNKMCFYDHLGSQVAINVKSYEQCPLTINV